MATDQRPAGPGAPRLGRPPGAFGKVNLTAHIDAVRDVFPDRAASGTVDELCGAMKPFLAAVPAATNVLAVIGGRKPLTRTFLRALHCGFGLHDFGLPLSMWLTTLEEFRLTLDALFIADPRTALRRIAANVPWVAMKTKQLLGAGAPIADSVPFVRVGDTVQIAVSPPIAGHLSVINADPVADSARYYWLDPCLGCRNHRLDGRPIVLPAVEPFIPIGPPVNVVSSLLAIVTNEPIITDWPVPDVPESILEIELPRMRLMVARVLGRAASARAVAIFDYHVLSRHQ